MSSYETTQQYIGRFAPSPTGPLHFGSLFAAVISYLHAKQHNGQWLVRIEDIDPLRQQKDADSDILKTLEAHGLFWDGSVVYQSMRSEKYEQIIAQLIKTKTCFYCPCSRKQLASNGGLHSIDCQAGRYQIDNSALKFRANQACYTWRDGFQGNQSRTLESDFVLKRKEGFYAYQLAVVCDDLDQNISHVVRGYDLIDSTPMQLALYEILNKPAPTFTHFPVICHAGQKLSKQNLAPAISNKQAIENLYSVFNYLGISGIEGSSDANELLRQAEDLWKPVLLNRQKNLSLL